MEIGHSRLLKFLLPSDLDRPMMSEKQELRVEYISEPTNVESEVPGQQKLREPSADGKSQDNGDTSDKAKDDDSTFVPVFTSKKEEAVFTRGDLKLQKVSVSEDISKNKIANPMYSEVHSEVIKDEQPMRTVAKDSQSVEEPADNKPRSKIPMLRLKTEMFKQDADEMKTKKVPSRRLRRSSIPKLKKAETLSNKETEKRPTNNVHTENNNVSTTNDNGTENIVPPEEEFEKIFDEIIHNNSEPILNTNVLVDSFEDAEKLEHSFDELMHDYEENNIQPIDIKQIRSKTPYKKQKSLPEQEFVKKLERRSSLKDIPIDNKDTEKTITIENSKLKTIQIRNNEKSFNDVHEKLKPKSFDENTKTSMISNISVEESSNHEIKQTSPMFQKIKNNSSKEQMQHKEIKDETDKINSNQECINIAPEQCKTGEKSPNKIIGKTIENEKSFQITETHFITRPVEKGNEEITVTAKESTDIVPESKRTTATQIPKLRGKVSLLTSKFSSKENSSTIPSKTENSNEKPNKRSIISKIGIFNRNKTIEKDIKYDRADPKIIIKSYDTKLNACSSEQVKNYIKEPPYQETDLNSESPHFDATNKESDEEDIDKSSTLAAKIRRDSVEKLKFERSESMPTGIANTLNIKNKLSANSVTPPNTPQVYDYEPYKDSAHLVGEPKILNIDVSSEFGEMKKDENRYKKSIKIVMPHHKTHESDSTDQNNTNAQKTNSEKINVPKQLSKNIYNQTDDNKDQIDFNSPNPDEFDRAPLFEAVNKKINTESKHSENEGFLIKGNVSKIITRIDSKEAEPEPLDAPKIQDVVELPLKKSVSTRIAMFERQTSIPADTKPKLKLLLDSKPRIIEEVLKAQPPRQAPLDTDNHDTHKLNDEIESGERQQQIEASADGNIDNQIYSKNIGHVAHVVEIQDSTVDNVQYDTILSQTSKGSTLQGNIIHSNENENNVTRSFHEYNKTHDRIRPTEDENYLDNVLLKDDEKLKRQKSESVVTSVREKIKLVKSINEDDRQKSKSVAEIDLGDAVKGKVHQMIVRMNSIEKIDLEKKLDNINIRERPRKKSVFEKIALFEKKNFKTSYATSCKDNHAIRLIESAQTEAHRNRQSECPKTTSVVETTPAPEATPTPDLNEEFYKERIEALQNAKLKYGRMEDMMYMRLTNGQDLPVLLLGTALLDPILLPHIVGAAIDLGYRGIDTAFIYGNEKQIGQAIKAKIDDGTVKREDLFITGKLWSTFHRQDLVEQACSASLEALGLEYFDLYLIHNPMSFKEGSSPVPMIANVLQYSDSDYLQAWYGMEGLVEKGLTKSIGLSNFNSDQVAKVVSKGKIKPVVNQVECHPYLTQQRLDQFCADRQVTLQCYGTLGSKGTPAEHRENQDPVIEDAMVRVMAAGLNITPAQLLLRYQIECGHSVVTKCSSAAHLWDNIQAQTITLSAAQVDALHALNRNKRNYMFKGMGDTHRNYPFRIPF